MLKKGKAFFLTKDYKKDKRIKEKRLTNLKAQTETEIDVTARRIDIAPKRKPTNIDVVVPRTATQNIRIFGTIVDMVF